MFCFGNCLRGSGRRHHGVHDAPKRIGNENVLGAVLPRPIAPPPSAASQAMPSVHHNVPIQHLPPNGELASRANGSWHYEDPHFLQDPHFQQDPHWDEYIQGAPSAIVKGSKGSGDRIYFQHSGIPVIRPLAPLGWKSVATQSAETLRNLIKDIYEFADMSKIQRPESGLKRFVSAFTKAIADSYSTFLDTFLEKYLDSPANAKNPMAGFRGLAHMIAFFHEISRSLKELDTPVKAYLDLVSLLISVLEYSIQRGEVFEARAKQNKSATTRGLHDWSLALGSTVSVAGSSSSMGSAHSSPERQSRVVPPTRPADKV